MINRPANTFSPSPSPAVVASSNSPLSCASSQVPGLDSSYDFDVGNTSLSPLRPMTVSPAMEPSASLGSILASGSADWYLPHGGEQLPGLYQPEALRDPDGNDDALTLAFVGQTGDGWLFGQGCYHQADNKIDGPLRLQATDGGDQLGLIDSPSAAHQRHHIHEEHLVDLSHRSSRPCCQEPMLAGALQPDGGTSASELVTDAGLHTMSVRRLPLPTQSLISGPDFATGHRRSSASLQPYSNIYPGNGFDGGLSPVTEAGCPIPQQYPWYNTGAVPFVDPLLVQSPVTGLFQFPPTSAAYEPGAFAIFASPHGSVVSSPTIANPGHLFQPTQQHHSQHLPHQQQDIGQFIHSQRPYLKRKFEEGFQLPQNSMSMPQNSYTGFASNNQGPQKSSKKGGRRPKEEQAHLSPEEELKRKMRRERNKDAAARCRQRRLDHMTELSQQVSQLQDTQEHLQREVEQLAEEKKTLEYILKTHEPMCPLRGQLPSFREQLLAKRLHKPAGITVTAAPSKSFLPPIKLEDSGAIIDCDDKPILDPPLSSATGPKRMKMSSSVTPPSTTLAGIWSSPSSINRPDTLSFRTAADLDSPGIPIQTPSKIFAYDPLNGLNIATGLTPNTSAGLTPILSLANAAATLETPTTNVLGSMESAASSESAAHKALQPL